MKKIKLLFVPLLALSLASCGEEETTTTSGTLDEFVPTELDFSNFNRQTVLNILDNLQHNSGYSISFKVSHYENVNSEPTFVSNVTIGGRDSYTWAYETTNDVTLGAACNVKNDSFDFYVLKDGSWQNAESVEYSAEDCATYIDEEVNKIVIKEEYLSKIDFSHSTGTSTICSRSCYTFSYAGDYYLSVSLDKMLGLILYTSVTYTDTVHGVATRDCVEVQSFAISNVEIPAFPAN